MITETDEIRHAPPGQANEPFEQSDPLPPSDAGEPKRPSEMAIAANPITSEEPASEMPNTSKSHDATRRVPASDTPVSVGATTPDRSEGVNLDPSSPEISGSAVIDTGSSRSSRNEQIQPADQGIETRNATAATTSESERPTDSGASQEYATTSSITNELVENAPLKMEEQEVERAAEHENTPHLASRQPAHSDTSAEVGACDPESTNFRRVFPLEMGNSPHDLGVSAETIPPGHAETSGAVRARSLQNRRNPQRNRRGRRPA